VVTRAAGDAREAYELAAWFFVHRARCPNTSTKPILIFTGDEAMNIIMRVAKIQELCGDGGDCHISTATIFRQLMQKYQGASHPHPSVTLTLRFSE